MDAGEDQVAGLLIGCWTVLGIYGSTFLLLALARWILIRKGVLSMGLIEFIILAVAIGLVVWLVNTYAPIPGQIKTIILVAAVIVLILVLLRALGLFPATDIQIPRVR